MVYIREIFKRRWMEMATMEQQERETPEAKGDEKTGKP